MGSPPRPGAVPLAAACAALLAASGSRGLPEELPMRDQRPAQVRHLNQRMTMATYPSRAAWERRAAWLRDHVRTACGLLPQPPRIPLEPRVFGKLERDGYSIEKVAFQSHPGFYVCGNLYRPLGKQGPFPAVACPHGHWKEGRFGHEPGRGSVPGRCITLARMGCVVFSYDMVGYNDSGKQVSHRWHDREAELWGISVMGLQTWNSIRVIDFLQGLGDVDGERIGVTGASGGGTQTFMVMGIEPRVKAAAPVCMVSGIMQGGCICENAPLLRIETCNIEIAALMAPRPLLLVSATGDWTRETPDHEYPAIRSVYRLYDAADRVSNVHVDAGHNYNQKSREAVYTFFRRHLLGIEDHEFAEPPFTVEDKEDLLVWQGRELPEGAKGRDELVAYLVAQARRQRGQLLPRKPDDRKRFQETLGTAYRQAVLAELPPSSKLALDTLGTEKRDDHRLTRLALGRQGAGERVPASLYQPGKATTSAVLLVHPEGKAALAEEGTPAEPLASLLRAGHACLAIDAYLTGESASLRSTLAESKKDKRYFTTYNRTPLVERVQDILTALAYLEGRRDVRAVSLVGLGEAGAWCLLAAPFAPAGTRVVADLAGLTGDEDPRWADDLFTPCILKAGDLRTAAALAAPRPLFLHNLGEGLDTRPFRAAYRAAGASSVLRIERRRCGPRAIANWLGPG
ncbi:MAG: alpha/beta hydrolase family protein [Candidatus Brocadiia bacterium]